MKPNHDFIDVRQLMAASSIDEHCRLAENYFSRLTDWTYHLAKPLCSFEDAPQLLINFAVVLQGLELCPGLTVLEFGAGTCWASRMLTQLGCKVIACDVSASALEIGRELYRRNPPAGDRPEPEFLLFDGHNLNLPDASVDRIMCLDAFHHVPNPNEVLQELGRVLKPGGFGGFAEPGPEHSKSVQSQYEMRTAGVIENDIRIEEIWRLAQPAGFTDLKLAVFLLEPLMLRVGEFEDFLRGGSKTTNDFTGATRSFMQNQRNFFLYKGPPAPRDSRYRQGLQGKISLSPGKIALSEGQPIKLKAIVTNTSQSVWLPVIAGTGGVLLGCHVRNPDGSMFRESYQWVALTPGEARNVLPGETVSLDVELAALPPGSYVLEFDLVSNNICWFAMNDSEVVRVRAEVAG
ncbi:MAG TPA: class I SAM-dependent methyltransferase [Pyrinomonadaceae bacterium]|nr:class I SAM-dependent methyltransferase [Pyrinomonadaceae bacterium]